MGIVILLIVAGAIPSTFGIIKEKNVSVNISFNGYIQGLINDASEGDTIFVPSGTYYENIIIDKSITLIGETKNTTIIDGNEIGDVVYVSADWVNISGFTIRDCGYDYNSGIILYSNYSNITGNIILNNEFGISGSYNQSIILDNIIINSQKSSIMLYPGGNNTFSSNTIINNHYGIAIFYAENITISSNTITNNDIGIAMSMSNHNCIIYNSVTNNTDYGIVLDRYNNYNNFKNNNISKNYRGIYFNNLFVTDYHGDYNNITNNTITNNNEQGLLIYGNNNIIFGNIITNNHREVGIKGDGNIISDNTITNNNHDGIALNGNSNTIFINKITNNYENGIFLGGNNNTISYNIIQYNSVDGIRLYYSNNNIISNNIITYNTYNGISTSTYSNNNNNNTINDNTITNNAGGIYFYNDNGYNNIINNNILSNSFGIYLKNYNVYSKIINNTIKNHKDLGIFIVGNNNVIYHNDFFNNTINAQNNGNNTWNDGKKGNYWDDYKEKYPTAHRLWQEGIWDTPYEILGDGGNQDNFPLIKPFNEPRNKIVYTALHDILIHSTNLLYQLSV